MRKKSKQKAPGTNTNGIIVVIISAVLTGLVGFLSNISQNIQGLQQTDSVMATTAATIQPISSAILSDFPYPRGSAPPYGWYTCGGAEGNPASYANIMSISNPCIRDNYTVIFPNFGYGIRSTNSPYKTGTPLITLLRQRGRSKQHLVNMGCTWRNPDPNATGNAIYDNPACEDPLLWDSEIKKLRDGGITENDMYAFYQTDEQHDYKAQIAMYNAVKKYYPNVPVIGSVCDKCNIELNVPKLDVLVAQNYPDAHGEKIAGTYMRYKVHVPRWHNNKTGVRIPVIGGSESYGICQVQPNNISFNTETKIKDRVQVSIVMGVITGVQGVMGYKLGTAYPADCNGECALNTPCEAGNRDFYPMYNHIWPWIREAKREELPIQVLSGLTSGKLNRTNHVYDPNYEVGTLVYPAVAAAKFYDKNNIALIVSSSLFEPKETNTTNTVIIQNVPNGNYAVLGENRTITVSNNTIQDTFMPYQYHIYQQVSGLTALPSPTSPSVRPSAPVSTLPSPTSTTNVDNKIIVRAAGQAANGEWPVLGIVKEGSTQGLSINVDSSTPRDYTVTWPDSTLSINNLRVYFTNDYSDQFGNDRNVMVESITIKGQVYRTDAPTVYSEGSLGSDNSCAGGFKRNSWLNCQWAFFDFQYIDTKPTPLPTPSPSISPSPSIVSPSPVISTKLKYSIRAKGTYAGGAWPVIGIVKEGQTQGQSVSISSASEVDYMLEWPDTSLTIDNVRLYFTNDYHNRNTGEDRNVMIRSLTLRGVTYQTSSSTVYSEGSWSNTGCNGGYKSSMWLHCAWGYFDFKSN